MVLFCKDNKFNGTHQQAVSLTPLLSTVLFIRRVMQLKQKLLVVCCFLHRSIRDSHGRCPCHSVPFRCSNHFVYCPLHRSITDSHGRCPCCSVLIRCFNNSVCCREIHSLNAGVHCLVALIRFVVKIIVLFNTNSVRC